jgi:hypothetical protein
MEPMTRHARADRIGRLNGFLAGAIVAAALLATASNGIPATPQDWQDAIDTARDKQTLLIYAILALALALSTVSALVVKLLTGTIREATDAMVNCRRRERDHQ